MYKQVGKTVFTDKPVFIAQLGYHLRLITGLFACLSMGPGYFSLLSHHHHLNIYFSSMIDHEYLSMDGCFPTAYSRQQPLPFCDFSFSHTVVTLQFSRKSCLVTIRQLSIHGNVGTRSDSGRDAGSWNLFSVS